MNYLYIVPGFILLRYLDEVALHHLIDALCKLSSESMELAYTNRVSLCVSASLCVSPFGQSLCHAVSVCVSVCLCLCVRLSLYVSVCPCECQSVCVSVCWSVSASDCLSMCQSVRVYVCLSVFVCLCVCVYVGQSVCVSIRLWKDPCPHSKKVPCLNIHNYR